MGRRRKRKQERRSEQRSTGWRAREDEPDVAARVPDYLSPQAMDLLFGFGSDSLDEYGKVPAAVETCGGCLEFVEDEVGGRGECLHPGSGVLSPWTDTAACAFYARRRRLEPR